ncbi:xanthine dehydrogenase [Sporosarcina sp. P13]|uniref:nucleotidyltransferase family protein n=1 Tax=Sporosarcina sp. P13 TaxID=2048263 RepID=UPI000C172F66|nr:nucleotidyltransferase family protein [Sporosarcina sp. P13]PIC64864.1 xanthine dehydrogenase [Sporosarcina sp. P13]
MKIVGIYLAAGNSSRMGRHKLALPVGMRTVGSLALETALRSPLDEIYIITKDTDPVEWLSPHIQLNSACTIIKCPSSHKGQSESLRRGIQQAQKNSADAVMILLADQPFITVQMITNMINCLKSNPTCPFVATSFEQTIMPPVLFTSSMYPELLKIRGDKGARSILRGKLLQRGILLPCTDKRLVFDIDTKDDYLEFKKIVATK